MKKSLIAIAFLAASCAALASAPSAKSGWGCMTLNKGSNYASIAQMKADDQNLKKQAQVPDEMSGRAKTFVAERFGTEKPASLPAAKKSGRFTDGQYLVGAHDAPQVGERLMM